MTSWLLLWLVSFGLRFVAGRLNALGEALPRIEQRWAKLNPAPTRKIPVLIGGGGEKKTLKYVAKHADIWHSFSDAETLKHKLGVLAGHCERIGRDVAEIEVSAGAQDVDGAASLHAAGAHLITYGVGGPDYDLEPLKKLVAWRDSL